MSGTLNVRYKKRFGENTGNIILVLNGRDITWKTSTIYNFGPANSMILNANDNSLIMKNIHIRVLDMIKDSAIKPAIGLEKFKSIFQEDDRRNFLTSLTSPQTMLHQLETNAETFFASRGQIKKSCWIKDKQTLLSGENRYLFDCGFYESGLDFNWFATVKQLMQNFGNRIVDNAGRPKDMKESLPYNTTIEDSMFVLFGLPGCSVSYNYSLSRSTPYPNYNMSIAYPGVQSSTSSTVKDAVIDQVNSNDWFLGNNKKNQRIHTILDKKRTDASLQTAYTLLHTKEMGDFLQVLYMFIWYILLANTEPNVPKYAMTTGDKVVWLTCMTLSLNSFLAFVEKDKKNVKMRSIQYFIGKEYTQEDAHKNFQREKDKIIKDNERFLETIIYLKNHSDITITVQSVEYTFNPEFYNKIEEDVGLIIKELKLLNSGYEKSQTANEIDTNTQNMKMNYSIIYFIRGVNREFKISHSIKKYTARDTLWSPQLKIDINRYQEKDPAFKYGKMSFYEIGLFINKRPTQLGETKGGNIKQMKGGVKYDDEYFYYYMNVSMCYFLTVHHDRLVPFNPQHENLNDNYISKNNFESLKGTQIADDIISRYVTDPEEAATIASPDFELGDLYNKFRIDDQYNYLMFYLLKDLYLFYDDHRHKMNIINIYGDFYMFTNILFHSFELTNEVVNTYPLLITILMYETVNETSILTGRLFVQCDDFVNKQLNRKPSQKYSSSLAKLIKKQLVFLKQKTTKMSKSIKKSDSTRMMKSTKKLKPVKTSRYNPKISMSLKQNTNKQLSNTRRKYFTIIDKMQSTSK